ncbi:hypothetical protein TRV_06447, partial [Trichophyton verrucosum HKI 0517]
PASYLHGGSHSRSSNKSEQGMKNLQSSKRLSRPKQGKEIDKQPSNSFTFAVITAMAVTVYLEERK